MKFINLNIANNLTRAKEFATSSKTYITYTATSCISNTYDYGHNRLEATRTRIMSSIEPYTPHLIKSAEFAGALIITGVAFRVLGSISSHLPIDIIPATVVAGYALRRPDQAAQFVALYAIGSVLGKTSTLSTYSLPVIQAFALYIAVSTAVDYVRKKVDKND